MIAECTEDWLGYYWVQNIIYYCLNNLLDFVASSWCEGACSVHSEIQRPQGVFLLHAPFILLGDVLQCVQERF